MALNISPFMIPLPIFLAALVLVVAIIIVLTVIEAKLGKKAKAKREYEETYYQQKLAATEALLGDVNGFLISLDKIIRELFSEEVGFKTMGKYSELISELGKRQMFNEAAFCQKMQEALYSGERIDQKVLMSLHAGALFFVLRKEKKELKQPQVQNKVQNEFNENIMNYMKEGMKRGFTADELKNKLLSEGFDENEIDKVESYLGREIEAAEKARVQANTEKKILTNFFNPKNRDLEIIKQSVEEKDEIGKAEIIEIVPYKKEEPEKKAVNYPTEEPESYRRIGSMDDLERVKQKIDLRKSRI